MFEFFLLIYMIGVIVALCCACVDAHIEKQCGKNIDDFPAMAAIMAIFSWLYVYFFINRYF